MSLTVHDIAARISDDPGQDMAQHYLTLYTIARFLPGRRIVEVGVDDGSSTLPLLLGAAQVSGHLTSVDVKQCWDAQKLVQTTGYGHAWEFVQMDSAKYAETVVNRSLDLVLIDGDHSYEGVRADWNGFAPCVRIGGLLLLHDACNVKDFPGIQRLIDETIRPSGTWGCATLNFGYGLTVCERLR